MNLIQEVENEHRREFKKQIEVRTSYVGVEVKEHRRGFRSKLTCVHPCMCSFEKESRRY